MSTKYRMWKLCYAITKIKEPETAREREKRKKERALFVALIIMYTNYLSILSLFCENLFFHCFTICHTFCAFDSFNRHQQLLYIVASILFFIRIYSWLPHRFFLLVVALFVSDLHWNSLFSLLSAHSCKFEKKRIRIFRLALFGILPHCDDDGNANALTQSFQSNSLNRNRMQMKIYQSMFLNRYNRVHCTPYQRPKERNVYQLLAAFSFAFTKCVFFALFCAVLCRKKRKIPHWMQWLNLWFMDFILYALLCETNENRNQSSNYICNTIRMNKGLFGATIDSFLLLIFWFRRRTHWTTTEEKKNAFTNFATQCNFITWIVAWHPQKPSLSIFNCTLNFPSSNAANENHVELH